MSIAFASAFTVRNYTWTNWNIVRAAKNLIYQYDDDGAQYTIYGYDAFEIHMCAIYKGVVPHSVVSSGYSQSQNDSDKTDFETNYLAGSNLALAIGRVTDRMKVDASFSGTAFANADSFSSKTRVDVQTSSIALASGSFTTIYTYSGSGLLIGFNVEFNNINVICRLQIDGETVFSGNISTLNGLIGTGNDAARRQAGTGIVTSSSTLDWSLKKPIKFSSSVTISADANGGVLLSRNFTQGIFYLTKET